MMGEQVFRLLVGIGVGVWTARLLGPERFGALSYAIAFASIFGIVATLGLNRILVRELVSNASLPDTVQRLMNVVFTLRLMAAAFMYAICIMGAWLGGGQQLLLIALVAGSYFFSASDCIELYFQSRVQARIVVRARLLSFIVVTAVRVVLLISNADLVAFAAATLLEYVGAAIALQWAYRHKGMRFSGLLHPDWKFARQLLAESWPEILAGFSGLLFIRLDQVMLHYLSGPAAVGIFAVAARLSEAWYFIPSAIIASTFPNIVASRKISSAVYMRRLQLLMAALCAISYVAVLSATLFANPVVRLLYGVPYLQSASILTVHIWSGLFVSLGLASGSWIMAEKRVRLNLYRNLSGLAANIALNLLLIPQFGALGAAYATLLSLVVAYVLFDLFVPSMREIGRGKWKAILLVPMILKK
jgi:O-antigen/teichoic acid export membrane protein